MTQAHYSLAWDSYKSNICSGFSALQQNGEFVDMTIAADGHFVKVHQVIVALASPYLKKLLSSAPCQHPIIFLNNVPHKVVCYLLEYMYTGEVVVPCEYLSSFSDAAKQLHILGLESVSKHTSRSNRMASTTDNTDFSQFSGMKRSNTIEIDHAHLPQSARKVCVKHEGAQGAVNDSVEGESEGHDYSADYCLEEPAAHDDDDGPAAAREMDQLKLNPSSLLYTVSIRGSLQTILNRYMYNLNSTTARHGVRRWRCVDYRNKKCNAYLVTKGNIVVNRSHLHNHPFHDKRILAKIEKKAVFSAIDDVEAYREKEKARDEEELLAADRGDPDTHTGEP